MVQDTITPVQSDKSETVQLDRILTSWLRQLRGAKSDATVRAYGYAVRGLRDFLEAEGMPTDPAWVTTEHINAFLDDQIETNSPPTARLRRTYLSVFFNWLVEEGEIKSNPVKRAKVPKVEDRPNDTLTDDDWARLLETVKGRSVADRRDAAILRVLESSGMRRAEVAGLRIGDVDSDKLIVRARVKGGRVELRVIDEATDAAIARYLWTRKDADDPSRPLWLGRAGGALTADGLADIIRRRGAQAGIRVHPHMFRHRWAELGKASMSDENLMALGGWRSPIMLARYARATTTNRAIEAYREARKAAR
jgi:integrase/recombinase XerC